MSTLNVSNITDGTTTVGTSYVVNGSAKVWCHIDSSFSIQNSLNVASTTDEGGGAPNTFSINMTSAMNDSNYIALGNSDGTGSNPRNCLTSYTSASSYFVSVVVSDSPTSSTGVIAQTAAIGDLA